MPTETTTPTEVAPPTEAPKVTPAPETRGAKVAKDVLALLRARNSLLWIVTREEVRAERAVAGAAATAGYEVRHWDCARGVTDEDGDAINEGAKDPAAGLTAVRESKAKGVWIMRDLHVWLKDPTVLREVRSLARELPSTPLASARAIVILTPSGEVPPELAGAAVVINWPLPDRAEVAAILSGVVKTLPDKVEKPDAPTFDAAVDAAVGLTAEEASNCYAKSVVTTKKIDPAIVAQEKKRVVARERVLEWYDPDPRGLEAVGGLDALKTWLTRRKPAFSQRARDFGLPAPKGVLLVGIPGCGKSLISKAVSSAYGMPLLRMDVGALRSKWVGESEGNLRKALQVASAVAPCVLWLDEVEKALAGATQGAADGGVSADALGTILSWMQEKTEPVFIVATANDVRSLPPEFLRKGRFDEVFWVDLPTHRERVEVVAAALRAHGRAPESIDADEVAGACVDFTGAEIAALVPEALFAAFADGERAVTTEDLVEAAESVVPLAKTSGERIKALREWAQGRARPATKPGKPISVVDTSTKAAGRGEIDA